jgi:glycosyltransferase involved in cell wall biosynthesis
MAAVSAGLEGKPQSEGVLMKPRVLHVIKTLELGGAETNLRNLMSVFDPEKFEHHIAYSFGGELEQVFRRMPGVKLYKFAAGKHRNSSPYSAVIVARLWAYLVKNGIRIVHTHNFNAHFWAAYAARLAGAKVVEHVHDFRYFDPAELQRRKGDANLNRHIAKFKGMSERVIILTEQNRQFLIGNHFYPENKVRLIPNGIPMPQKTASLKSEVAAEMGLDAHAPIVFVASRMTPTKNMELVLRIAPKVLKEVPNATFLIAGNGELLAGYMQEAEKAGFKDRIRFIGFREDVQRLLAGCDVFWLPSYLELHSISILEAMSLGVPIVASAGVGSNSDVFTPGKDAFLLDPFSDEGWAETLTRLLKDPLLRASVGKNAQELCRSRFDIRNTARRFEELYLELLA